MHGLSSNARLWDGASPPRRCAVVAVDLRGTVRLEVPDVEPDATLAAAHDLAVVCGDVAGLDGAGGRGAVVGRQRRAPARGARQHQIVGVYQLGPGDVTKRGLDRR